MRNTSTVYSLDSSLFQLSGSQVLEDFGHAVSSEHSNDKWVAFAWPQRIAQQCEDTAGLLKQSRGLFEEEVRRRPQIVAFPYGSTGELRKEKYCSCYTA